MENQTKLIMETMQKLKFKLGNPEIRDEINDTGWEEVYQLLSVNGIQYELNLKPLKIKKRTIGGKPYTSNWVTADYMEYEFTIKTQINGEFVDETFEFGGSIHNYMMGENPRPIEGLLQCFEDALSVMNDAYCTEWLFIHDYEPKEGKKVYNACEKVVKKLEKLKFDEYTMMDIIAISEG